MTAFDPPLPFARPATPPLERVMERLRPSYEIGMLTNGPLVRQLEEQAAERLGVDHVVAVSNCTAGLILTLQALAPAQRVVLPSFTFSATAHAIAWNGLAPEFCECRPDSFQIDVEDAARRLEATSAGGLVATHVFGAPAQAEAIEDLGRRLGVPVVFDAAHGFGASRRGKPIGGFGHAEVFSLSPTKPVVAGEGGLVATRDGSLAEAIRLSRDYGNPGDYDTVVIGLNARMSELHAALGLESMDLIDDHLDERSAIATEYTKVLADVPGIRVQHIDDGDVSTYKDFTIAVDDEFDMTRDELVHVLRAEGIDTRCYFSPPVHRHHAYAGAVTGELPVTDDAAGRVISLPIYSSLPSGSPARIAEAVATAPTNR